jgi:DNA-binding XRE family transcriptional regulator/quercetin dioxygenase-like cupin family protein
MPADGDGRFHELRLVLAERRRALGLTMSELAREVGISPSMVSQIERGQTLPSVPTLFALADALGANIDLFFDELSQSADSGVVAPPAKGLTAVGAVAREHLYGVRGGERGAVEIRGGVRWERLTPRPLKELEFLELVYPPGAESSPDLYRHPGIEMVLVLSGAFRIHIGFEEYVLSTGDSMQFPSSLPHRYVNPSTTESRAVTVIVPDAVAPPAGDELGMTVESSLTD